MILKIPLTQSILDILEWHYTPSRDFMVSTNQVGMNLMERLNGGGGESMCYMK